MSVKSSNPILLAVPKSKRDASQNWKTLMAQTGIRPTKRRRIERPTKLEGNKIEAPTGSKTTATVGDGQFIPGFPRYDSTGKLIGGVEIIDKRRTWCLGMDCEMVGVGPQNESALARVSIVNEAGYCLLDTFVKPKVKVTDYRTPVSGVREQDLINAENFDVAVRRVAELLKDRVVVGHALENDFRALLIRHPKQKIRDTSRFYKKFRRPALKFLARKFLNLNIQDGEHNSILDAQAAMKLYLINRKSWEEQIKSCKQARRRGNKDKDN